MPTIRDQNWLATRRAALTFAMLAVTSCAHNSPTSARFSDCETCPQMVGIETGSFSMGSDLGEPGRSEGPVVQVEITRRFALSVTEITFAQFETFASETGHRSTLGCRVFLDGEWTNSPTHHWRDPGPGVAYGPDHPVVCVSWEDASAYVQWLSDKTGEPYRLPSEAEWEYAANAGANTAFPWGDSDEQACANGNVYDRSARTQFTFSWDAADCDDREASLSPVGQYAPNAFGLHDMIGNVWEWTADCYELPYSMRADRQLAQEEHGCDRRTVRGGSWITRGSRLRPAFRGRDPIDARMNYFGFRVARDLR